MKHFMSVAVFLVGFFLTVSGLDRHVLADSTFVVAADDNGNVSEEVTQAKALAEDRYSNFIKAYEKIWSIYGFYHKEFNGTPGNIRYARVVKNWQNYSEHRKKLLDITDKLSGSNERDAQAKAEGYSGRNWQLEMAVDSLGSEIEAARLEFAEMEKTRQFIVDRAQAANTAMNKACTAKTRIQAKPFVEESIKSASQAISDYKLIRNILTQIEKKRQKYEALHSELATYESFVGEHRNVYKKMIDSENEMLKDLQPPYREYFANKQKRFYELMKNLERLHSELESVLRPYQYNVWAKEMLDDADAVRIHIETICRDMNAHDYDNLSFLGEAFHSRAGVVSIPKVYDKFIGVENKLETFYGLASSIQEVNAICKTSAVKARDDAKEAMACAKNLPEELPRSNMDQGCPSDWNNCRNICCPPDVPCWDYGAIKKAVKEGRCR